MRNLLIVVADHLSAQAVGALGNAQVNTPNLDRLVHRGRHAPACYTVTPLCQPSRAAFWTSRFPHELGIRSNGRNDPITPVPDDVPTLSSTLSAAGYRCTHFGKEHDAGALRGFERVHTGQEEFDGEPGLPLNYDTWKDAATMSAALEHLQAGPEGPFATVVDLNNPHNICGWIGAFAGPDADPGFDDTDLPPLPDNFDKDDPATIPPAIAYLCCSHRRQAQAAGWSELQYRRYLKAFYHYVERWDQAFGELLEALATGGHGEDTVVLVMADHGEGMAAHRMVTKQVAFYEETNRVPFILGGADLPEDGTAFTEQPTSLLDLFPTVCGLLDVAIPDGLRGVDLSPQVTGSGTETGTTAQRDYVVGEWHTEFGEIVTPGRMVRSQNFKYCRYLEGNAEQFFDLRSDPGETRNLVNDPEFAQDLQAHRDFLADHIATTNDDFEDLSVKVDPRWRSHAPGFANHGHWYDNAVSSAFDPPPAGR
jgi:choline-sulfatase